MSKRIFRGIFLVAMAVLTACFAMTIFVMYDNDSRNYTEWMADEARYIGRGVELDGITYLNSLRGQDNTRITWIEADGTVKYDNTADAAGMENHAGREEVKEALAAGAGESERFSATLAEKMTYYAIKLSDGTVLRVAASQHSIYALALRILEPMAAILIAALLLSFLLASRISKSIVKPINEINLEHPENSKVYDELSPLAERLKHQNDIIAKQMEELKQEHDAQDKMRREFTANVSHELKTPLTSISGFAEIMRGGIVKSEDIPRFSGYIYDEAQRLISLVGDIIKLSQMDDNELPVKKVRIDLYDSCAAVMSTLGPSADKRNIKLELKGEHAQIFGAEQIVDEIIYNLCDNAIKYNKTGGSVTVSVLQKGKEAELAVSDTGIGIPEAEQRRVFERFYRVNKSPSMEMGGTGLGLSIVKHGAAYHNARLELDSEPEKGTTIRVIFKTD